MTTMRMVLGVAWLALASAAAAQSLGNPPGNTLAPATGTVAPPAPPVAAPPGDKLPAQTPAELAKIKYQTEVVCKTSVETGSLIARHKTCLTRKQWQYVNDENERSARKIVEDNMGKPGGN